MRSILGTTPSITLAVNRFVAGATFVGDECLVLRMKPSSLFLVALLAAIPCAAGAQNHCSRETLVVRGTPVTIGYCVNGAPEHAPGGAIALAVQGSYSAPGGSFARNGSMRFINGDGPSRVMENVELSQLGLQGTLHLTLVYAGGLVRVESAMLTPGAVTVK